MSDTTTNGAVSAEVTAERQRIAREILTWAQGAGYSTYAETALRAVGLDTYQPRTTAEVQVTVVGTVTVPVDWNQNDALTALESAVRNGRASVEVHEVTDTGAPATE